MSNQSTANALVVPVEWGKRCRNCKWRTKTRTCCKQRSSSSNILVVRVFLQCVNGLVCIPALNRNTHKTTIPFFSQYCMRKQNTISVGWKRLQLIGGRQCSQTQFSTAMLLFIVYNFVVVYYFISWNCFLSFSIFSPLYCLMIGNYFDDQPVLAANGSSKLATRKISKRSQRKKWSASKGAPSHWSAHVMQ